MSRVDRKLWDMNKVFEGDLAHTAASYLSQGDARWMFAKAHYYITVQINAVLSPLSASNMFRGPNELLRFNMSFASAFLAAVAGKASAPWKQAFAECAVVQASYTIMFPTDNFESFRTKPFTVMTKEPTSTAVLECSISMADAHINTDILNSLKAVGCIDPHDYGNMLLFVNRGSEHAISDLIGQTWGPKFESLKETLMPLDRIWRNKVYETACHVPVPGIEPAFIQAVAENSRRMMQIVPSVH
jgi:hypothetical protein